MIEEQPIGRAIAQRSAPRSKHALALATGWCIVLFSVCSVAAAQSGPSGCGSLANSYGPYDYRVERDGRLKIVEQYHFTSNVESLVKGNSGSLGGELSYTLRASPNHHRALMAMIRLGEKLKSPHPEGSGYSVECWFERALRFRPDDSTVRLIYATFLVKDGRVPDATKQLEIATARAADNAFTQYNAGMIYFDMKNYDAALVQAHKAYGLGFPQLDLRDKLQSAGKWKEPTELPPESPEKSAK